MDNKQIINMICAFKGISQAQAARLAGRPAQSFNHSIKHNNISLDDFIKLCASMGMAIDIKDAHNNIVLSLSATHRDETDAAIQTEHGTSRRQ